jgi:prolyl oligopeptidase
VIPSSSLVRLCIPACSLAAHCRRAVRRSPPRRARAQVYARLLSILESKEKIPYINKRGRHYYNFWRDSVTGGAVI